MLTWEQSRTYSGNILNPTKGLQETCGTYIEHLRFSLAIGCVLSAFDGTERVSGRGESTGAGSENASTQKGHEGALSVHRNATYLSYRPLSNMKYCRYLRAQDNNLSLMPPVLSSLTALEELRLDGNRLTSLPESLQTLKKVTFFQSIRVVLLEKEKKLELLGSAN